VDDVHVEHTTYHVQNYAGVKEQRTHATIFNSLSDEDEIEHSENDNLDD